MSIILGNEFEFLSSDGARYNSACGLDISKFIVAYQDTNTLYRGMVKIGTISGKNIVFSTRAAFNFAETSSIATTPLTTEKFVVAYKNHGNFNNGTVKIGTINGITTYGAETTFLSPGSAVYIALATLDASKFVVVYTDVPTSYHGTARIGTVSGTTVTFGAEEEFSSGSAVSCVVTALSESKFVVAYTDEADSSHGTAKVGTVSGTTITFGEETEFLSAFRPRYTSITTIDASRFVIAYRDESDSNHGTAKIGTISGTTITFSDEVEFLSEDGSHYISTTLLDTSKFIVAYSDAADSGHGTAKIGTIDDTIITFGNEIEFLSAGTASHISTTLFNVGKFAVVYTDGSDSNHGTARIGTIPVTITKQCNLFMFNSEVITTSGNLLVIGHRDIDVSGNLFMSALEPITISGNLRIHGQDDILASGGLFIYGDIEISGVSSPSLFVHGHEIAAASGDLFIEGHIDSSGTPAPSFFIHGHDKVFAFGNSLITGHNSAVASEDLFISSHITALASSDLHIWGLKDFVASGNLFVGGNGIIDANGNSVLFINGYEPKPALVCPALDPTASIQIKDSLIRIYQSRIDALINQLGKNVYLEFDPIREPCINCEFDTIRKRSTGIYKTDPAGPRPFTRGRKCPYCKGRGFTETAVNKCIKCLIKWNPSEAQNFGIAVSQTKGIVRLKTYLTEADDLMRAKTVVVNHDISNQMQLRVRLIQGPIPVGLREDRYCISFWELI